MCGRGVKNVDLLECLNLNDYQFKASRYNYGSPYMNPVVTTNQNPTVEGIVKERKKGIQAYYKRKSSNHNGRNKKKRK